MFSINRFRQESPTLTSSLSNVKTAVKWEKNPLLTPMFHRLVTPQSEENETSQTLKKLYKMQAATKTENDILFKEIFFQDLLRTQYTLEMENISPELSPISGLYALLMQESPDLTPATAIQVAYILKGDLISYLKKNPSVYSNYFGLPEECLEEALETYLNRLKEPKEPLGISEMFFFSQMLKTPIFIHTSASAIQNRYGKIVPNKRYCFGKDFSKPILHLYYDPVNQKFHLMIQTSSFSV